MPELPPARLAERRKTRQLDVGGVLVGGGAPISVQSMTTTVTADVNATLQQIAELTATGCQIVRVAVPDPWEETGHRVISVLRDGWCGGGGGEGRQTPSRALG
jgi:hypothetical protein